MCCCQRFELAFLEQFNTAHRPQIIEGMGSFCCPYCGKTAGLQRTAQNRLGKPAAVRHKRIAPGN